MSLTLYGGIIQVTAGRRVELVAEILEIPLDNKRIPGAEWKQPEHLKRNPFGKIPAM